MLYLVLLPKTNTKVLIKLVLVTHNLKNCIRSLLNLEIVLP